MDDLFTRLSQLIGQETESPAFEKFVQDVQEQPLTARALYFFPEAGFSLVAAGGMFVRAFLNVRTPRDPGYINAYSGNLPNGVSPNDSRDVFREKLAGKLVSSNDTEDQFDFAPLLFFVRFAKDGSGVCSLSLGYGDDNLPEGMTLESVESSGGIGSTAISHRPMRRRAGPRHRPGRGH